MTGRDLCGDYGEDCCAPGDVCEPAGAAKRATWCADGTIVRGEGLNYHGPGRNITAVFP